MQKLLIINADDFGMSTGVDAAIKDLIERKTVTSTTVMANFVSRESIRALKKLNASTGFHLNLVEGKPISDPRDVKSLIDENGNFYSSFHFFKNYTLGKINKIDIKTEINNQVQFIANQGLTISHADSHQHIHQFPFLSRFITNSLKDCGIKKIRNCNPLKFTTPRMILLKTFSAFSHGNIRDFKHPSGLFNYFSVNSQFSNSLFISELVKLYAQHSCIELMTHPATENVPGSYLNRVMEYDFLKGLSVDFFNELNIKLINYNEL
jgi:chitin disaccharide deacetylase